MVEFQKESAEFERDMEAEGYHPYSDSTGFLYLIILARRDILRNTIERHKLKVRCSSPSSWSSTDDLSCPIGHFHSPAPHPFSPYSVLEASQSRKFTYKPWSPDRKLRVPIMNPYPWAHCLQLFESDAEPRRYACYISYTAGRPGVKREIEPLAPVDSTWSFAWEMFTKFFKLKSGIEWDARHVWSEARDASGLRIDGEDAGMPHKKFEYVPPREGLPQGLRRNSGADGPAAEASRNHRHREDETRTDRRPSATGVMPGIAVPEQDDIMAGARTPDGGC